MRIAAQRQPEMPHILRRIIGLGLAAQDHLHDLRLLLRLTDLRDQLVEGGRLHHLPQREADVESRQIILQCDQLVAARRFMNAVHDRRLFLFQRLGRRDIGGDHIILDQHMRVQPLAHRHAHDLARLVQHDPPFRQVQRQRIARLARLLQQGPARPERLQGRLQQRIVLCPVYGRLRILIGQHRRHPDHRAGKAPRRHLALRVDRQMARHRRPVLARA